MDGSPGPRYDQAPENFSESGQKRNRDADRPAVENVTQGEGSTAASMYSFCSLTDLKQYLREEGGRNYNTLNKRYFLPTDDLEFTRINKLHTTLYIALGGLYPCSQVVCDVLKQEDRVSKEVLDLGCGSGLWAIELAQKYQHIMVTGVDLVPPPLELEQLPNNFQVEVDDINLGLSHFYDRFDLVHMRWVYYGLKARIVTFPFILLRFPITSQIPVNLDYQRTLHEVQKCLKPGGMALVFVPELDYLDERRSTYIPMASDDNPDGSWNQRLAYETQAMGELLGGDQNGIYALLDKGFWDDDDIMDPETCGTGSIYLPIGPWATSSDQDRNNRLQFSGALTKQIIMSGLEVCRPLFIKCGLPPDTVDEWMKRSGEEFRTLKFKGWLRVRMAWGRRRAGPGLPAPPLSVPDIYIPLHLQSNADAIGSAPTISVANNSGSVSLGTPKDQELYQVEVYGSKEESLEVVRRRMALREPIGPALVTQTFSQLQKSSS